MSHRPLLPIFVLLWSSGYVVGAAGDPGRRPAAAARVALRARARSIAVPLALRHGRWRGAPLGRLALVGLLLQVVQFGGIYGGFALGVPAALSALVILGLSPLVTTALAVAIGQERARRAAVGRARRRRRSACSRSASRPSSGARSSASALG